MIKVKVVKMGNNFWSNEEKKVLKKYYPILGAKTKQFLPNRTIGAIEHEARRQNIKYGLFEVGEEAFLDIETTNINADFAFMLSYAFKVKDKNEVLCSCITREEVLSGQLDKRLIKDFVKTLRKFKRIYTYYGDRFDVPFARTRALVHKIEFPPYGLIQHQDLYYLARAKLKISSNRLERVCDILSIKGKTHLKPRTWTLATTGDTKSIAYVLDHNIKDIIILEKAYNKLKVYATVQRRSI